MNKYDVVIIGAGPAGLNCAWWLARSGKQVLLLEKNAEIGPKICAGGLTKKSLEYLDLPDESKEFEFDQIHVSTPHVKAVIGEKRSIVCMINRERLAQWQLEKLAGTNACIKTASPAKSIEDGCIILNGGEKIFYKFLVGADGSNSIVRKYLKLKTENIGVGIQYIIPNNGFDKVEFYMDAEKFDAWYAWIFPHKEHVSIGCGGNGRKTPVWKLKQNLEEWMRERKIDYSGGRFEAHPINCDYRGYAFGNIFLAGDAAGLASCLTGEGIYQALVSGEEVAKMIIDDRYGPVKLEQIINKKRAHDMIIGLLERSVWSIKITHALLATLLKTRIFSKKILEKV